MYSIRLMLLLRVLESGKMTPYFRSFAVVKVIKYSLQVSFGGIAFGFVMAKTTIFWLRNIFNDALAEITITLASTYLTFYIGNVAAGEIGSNELNAIPLQVSCSRSLPNSQ